jgi:hypothetical protein
MNVRFSLLYGMIVTLSIVQIGMADDASKRTELKIIPLDQIWGYEMPGTRDIRGLEPKRATSSLSDKALIRSSLVLQIRKALQQRPRPVEKAGPAFVVAGSPAEALRTAAALMMMKNTKEPERIFPADTQLSLFFYSYISAYYVRLVSAEEGPNLIQIKYRAVPHSTTDSTVHFALIPLGKRSKGAVQVKIEQLPTKNEKGETISRQDRRDLVCDSFSFAIEK